MIAKVIESLDMNPSDKMMVAEKFAGELAKINPRFNRLKFINACFPARSHIPRFQLTKGENDDI